MSEMVGDRLRLAISSPILSERTLRYKRNMFLAAALAAIHTYGKIDSNKFKLSGAEYILPNADTTVGLVILMILLYLLIGYYRYASSNLRMWKAQFKKNENDLFDVDPVSHHWGSLEYYKLPLHREFHDTLRFNSTF